MLSRLSSCMNPPSERDSMNSGQISVSDLTIEELMTADLEAMEDEQDPPSFTRARKKDKERLNLMELDTKINNDLSHLEEVIEEYLNVEPKVVETLEESNSVTSGSQGGMDSLLISPPEFAARHVSAQPCSPGLGVKDTVEEYLAPTHTRTDKEGIEEATDELDLNGINDEEIDTYILTKKEVEWKTAMWTKVNKEYLEEQEMKAKREEEKREEIVRKRVDSNNKKRCNLRKNETVPEVIEKLELGKKISTKINYDVLKNLNISLGDSSVTTTEKKNETTESSCIKLEKKETAKERKQTIFSSQRLEKFSKDGTRSKRQRLSQKPNLVSRKFSLIKEVKQGVQSKCQDVLGVREPVVEEGNLLHSEGIEM